MLGEFCRSANQFHTTRLHSVTVAPLFRTLLLIVLLLPQGCSLLQEEPISIPRGTPISIDQLPASVVAPGSLPDGTIVERYDNSGSFRIEYPDGTITILDSQGSFQGRVM